MASPYAAAVRAWTGRVPRMPHLWTVRQGRCREGSFGWGREMTATFSQRCYAAMASDEIRAVSSSGGAFTLFARWILSQGGVVYGAAFDDRMECRYEEAADESGLSRLRGSKYVKAELSRVAIEGVRRRLADGVPVLFVGVPCQVAAVKNLCKDDLRNLYTIDLVCNGTPAREMFRSYSYNSDLLF